MIDARLGPEAQEVITPGAAVAGMVLNGLGFANRPLSLTPQFVANKPLDLLFHEGLRAAALNRFQLGRPLDEVDAYGCGLLCSELALAVCAQDGVERRFQHLDTTSVALTGEYLPDGDEQAIAITHGYSQDHRPALKQAVVELMVSQDGGVPFVSQRWDGHASATPILHERAQALMATLQASPTPRYLVADSKLYHEDHAAHRPALGFITRIAHTRKLVSQVITQALRWDTWHRLDDATRDQRAARGHDGMAQRGLVVYSPAALERADATVSTAQQREYEATAKQLFHLQARRFETSEAAKAALAAVAKRWTYHQVDAYTRLEHKRYGRKGRPTPTSPIKVIAWPIHGPVRAEVDDMERRQQSQACFVLGTNMDEHQVSAAEVIRAYKGQGQAEGGFRFLKDPRCFVASLLVKQPARIQGLLTVMTIALLVYSVAQRRLRQQ
jgi:transposase